MVPALLSTGGRRSADLNPHASFIARRTGGLEASIFDFTPETISSFDGSRPTVRLNIANEGALLIAKLVKVSDRIDSPQRFQQKDCYDVYRLLWATPAEFLVTSLNRLNLEISVRPSVAVAIKALELYFASSEDALGSRLAGQAEFGIGDPNLVSARTMAMAREFLSLWRKTSPG